LLIDFLRFFCLHLGFECRRGSRLKSNIAGTWQGTAHVCGGHDLRFVLKIAKDEKGTLSATLYSIEQKEKPMAGDAVRFEGGTLRFVNQFPGLTYEGRFRRTGIRSAVP
jgi:hypothetical protein